MVWLELVLAIIGGLATAIPLAIKLIEYVKKYVQEKNYGKLMELVMEQMMIAEKKLEKGIDKKEYVMAAVVAASNRVNYNIDEAALSDMIDKLCAMSKVVNAPTSGDVVGGVA